MLQGRVLLTAPCDPASKMYRSPAFNFLLIFSMLRSSNKINIITSFNVQSFSLKNFLDTLLILVNIHGPWNTLHEPRERRIYHGHTVIPYDTELN